MPSVEANARSLNNQGQLATDLMPCAFCIHWFNASFSIQRIPMYQNSSIHEHNLRPALSSNLSNLTQIKSIRVFRYPLNRALVSPTFHPLTATPNIPATPPPLLSGHGPAPASCNPDLTSHHLPPLPNPPHVPLGHTPPPYNTTRLHRLLSHPVASTPFYLSWPSHPSPRHTIKLITMLLYSDILY